MTHRRFILCIVYNNNVSPLLYQAHLTYRVNFTVMAHHHSYFFMFKICVAINFCHDDIMLMK